jgi:hypothetical protein
MKIITESVIGGVTLCLLPPLVQRVSFLLSSVPQQTWVPRTRKASRVDLGESGELSLGSATCAHRSIRGFWPPTPGLEPWLPRRFP